MKRIVAWAVMYKLPRGGKELMWGIWRTKEEALDRKRMLFKYTHLKFHRIVKLVEQKRKGSRRAATRKAKDTGNTVLRAVEKRRRPS